MRRAAPWPLPPDKGGTVWMGAIDAAGLAVSFIQSVFWDFGSGCVLPRTGVLMQNRGAAFSLDPEVAQSARPRAAAVPHPQSAARRVRRRPRPRLRLEGRRRPAAIPGAGVHPHRRRRSRSTPRSPRRGISSPARSASRRATVKLEEGYDESTAAALAAAGHAIERRERGRARPVRPRRRADARAQGRDRRRARPALGRRRGGNLRRAARSLHENVVEIDRASRGKLARGAAAY